MNKAIIKSKEDIDLILSISNLVRCAVIFGFVLLAIFLAPLIIAPKVLNDMMLGTANGKLAELLSPLLISVLGNSIKANGTFSPILYVFFICQMAIQCAVSYTIFDTLYKVFKDIKNDETPFTTKNVRYWKRCSRIYGVIAMLYFFLSFILRGASIVLILPALLANTFFNALSIIFEYGSQLQKESDETF